MALSVLICILVCLSIVMVPLISVAPGQGYGRHRVGPMERYAPVHREEVHRGTQNSHYGRQAKQIIEIGLFRFRPRRRHREDRVEETVLHGGGIGCGGDHNRYGDSG